MTTKKEMLNKKKKKKRKKEKLRHGKEAMDYIIGEQNSPDPLLAAVFLAKRHIQHLDHPQVTEFSWYSQTDSHAGYHRSIEIKTAADKRRPEWQQKTRGIHCCLGIALWHWKAGICSFIQRDFFNVCVSR